LLARFLYMNPPGSTIHHLSLSDFLIFKTDGLVRNQTYTVCTKTHISNLMAIDSSPPFANL
jgi:hypothetical protein